MFKRSRGVQISPKIVFDESPTLWNDLATIILHEIEIARIQLSFFDESFDSGSRIIQRLNEVFHRATDQTVGFRTPPLHDVRIQTTPSTQTEHSAFRARLLNRHLWQFQRVRIPYVPKIKVSDPLHRRANNDIPIRLNGIIDPSASAPQETLFLAVQNRTSNPDKRVQFQNNTILFHSFDPVLY